MRLISLETKNFKKLGNSSFKFTGGINAIVGDNAKGKSTTLQAIESALFGVSVVPGKKESIPTWGQTTFSVILTFTLDPSLDYESYYVLTRTKTTAKLEEYAIDSLGPNPTLVANGNTPVTAYVENLLGLKSKDYNLFVQSKQGETAGVLTFGGVALSRKVEEFAGVDTIDKVQAASVAKMQEATAEVNLYSESSELLEASKGALKEVEARLRVSRETLRQVTDAYNCLEEPALLWPHPTSEELVKTRRQADKHLKRVAELESEVKRAEAVVDSLVEDPVEEPETPDTLRSTAAALKSKIKTLSVEKADYLELVRKADSMVSLYRDSAEKADNMAPVEKPTSSVDELSVAADELSKKRLLIQSRIQNFEELLRGSICPTCGTKLSEHDPDKLRNQLSEARKEAESAIQQHTQAVEELRESRRQWAEFDRLKGEAESYRDLVAEIKAEADKAISLVEEGKAEQLGVELQAAEDQLAEVAASLIIVNKEVDAYESYQRRLKKAVRSLKLAQEELFDLDDFLPPPTDQEIDEAAITEAENREKESEYKSQVQALKAQKLLKEEEVKTAERDLKISQELVEANSKAVRRKVELEGIIDQCKRLYKFLGERRNLYLQEVWQAVMAFASSQVSASSGGTITGIIYRDGNFYYVEDAIEAPVESASGAQKAHIGVAVRIALSRVLYGSDSLLILDEPTESMSEYHATNLAGSLATAAKQLFLITHREQDQALAKNIIEL